MPAMSHFFFIIATFLKFRVRRNGNSNSSNLMNDDQCDVSKEVLSAILEELLLFSLSILSREEEEVCFPSSDYIDFTIHLELASLETPVETQRVNHSGESEIYDETATLSLDLK